MKVSLPKKLHLYVAGVCLLLIVFLISFCLFTSFSHHSDTQYVYIDDDDTADSVVTKLAPIGSRYALFAFSTLARHSSYATGNICTGRYAIEPDDAVITVFRNISRGRQTPIRLTIPEARTMPRLASLLSHRIMADSTTLATIFTDSTLLSQYEYTPETLPALFIPNTYEIYWDISPEKFLERMKREHDAFWTSSRRKNAIAIGMTPNEVATLASIIDEESSVNSEKPMIAGMYINRLHADMPLQADPTVKYALGDFSLRRIYRKHLLTPSPYNTYTNTGLPPGPIKIASTAAIDAVLNHTRHDYLYMCANADFSGTHIFARTYADHLANAARYSAALNERGIK